ncbi:MAG: tyrosine-protein phosphatase [Galactobacter sp.]
MPNIDDISGLANARDLGGLLREDGSHTPVGSFIRSERLDLLSPDDWELLEALGVRTILDLRRPEESSGSVRTSMNRVQVDLDGDDREFWSEVEADGSWCTPLYYTGHLQRLPHRLADALDAIGAVPPGGVLFHCGAGWDRTGLVAAVLLKAVGVTVEAAVADYVASFHNHPRAAALHGLDPREAEARIRVLADFGLTPEAAFHGFYTQLDLGVWFERSNLAQDVREAVRTWRGQIS